MDPDEKAPKSKSLATADPHLDLRAVRKKSVLASGDTEDDHEDKSYAHKANINPDGESVDEHEAIVNLISSPAKDVEAPDRKAGV